MKAFIVAFVLIAAISAEPQAHGYRYPEPQPSFHDEYLSTSSPDVPVYQPASVVHHHPAPVVHQNYLPPVAPQAPTAHEAPVYQSSPVVHHQPAPVVHHQPAPHVQQKYLPPAADFSEETGYSYRVPSA